MKIIFYKTDSDIKRINKILNEPVEKDININHDINNYEFYIKLNSILPIEYNYCFIPSLNKYFFITDIDFIGQNLWEIKVKCDVLMTYRTEILNGVATAVNSENSSLRYYNTSDIPYDVRKTDIISNFNNPFNDGINIMIGVAGKPPTA